MSPSSAEATAHPLDDPVAGAARHVLRPAVVVTAVAALLGWGVAALLAGGLVGVWLFPGDAGGLPSQVAPPDARTYELDVHVDGCGVVRRQVLGADDLPGLQWVVTGPGGEQVLARNALGEDRYRHHRPGPHTVVLQAWDGDGYTQVSQAVDVTC